jgi:cation:H+ antiporter
MDLLTWGMLGLGLVVLIGGAELLVRGASQLAAAVGISSLVIGLTVVSFGTSAPELAVSIQSSLAGQPDLAIGNVVGSNICNILLILGICATITPLVVARQLIRLDVPLMIGVSLLLFLLARDGQIGRWDGGLLFGGIIAYIVFTLSQSRREHALAAADADAPPAPQPTPLSLLLQVVLILAGLGLLILGANWLVTSAVTIARALGVSELVIGLTVIAIGTSLPEVATSTLASIRGERDLAVGNVVGSNLFNILTILGLTSLITPINVAPAAIRFDLPIMITVALACLPIFFTGMQIARWEGLLFLCYYLAYTLFLILTATQSAALPLFSIAMLGFALPLTAVTLLVLAGYALWQDRRTAAGRGG